MKNVFRKILILMISCFCFVSQIHAAEILQVSSSSVLLIGDHNRTYRVKLACTQVNPELEEKAVIWLKKELPRNTKVNLKPQGSLDGSLIAKVIPFNSNIDINEKYINEGLATKSC